VADVDGGGGVGGEFEVGDGREGSAEDEDGVGGAGVGPGVATGAGDGDAEAEAAESSGDDGGGPAAFEGDGGGDAAVVGAALEEVAHASEVAFAFFAYIGGEEDGDRRGNVRVAECGGDSQEGGEAGSVVADAGSIDACGVFEFDGIAVGSSGEDGVEMCRDEDTGGRG